MIQWNYLKRYVHTCRQKVHACFFSPVVLLGKVLNMLDYLFSQDIVHGKELCESNVLLLDQVASSHTSSASSSSQGGVNAEELVQKIKLLTSGVREFTFNFQKYDILSSSYYKLINTCTLSSNIEDLMVVYIVYMYC